MNEPQPSTGSTAEPKPLGRVARILRVALPLPLIALGIGGAGYLYATRPRPVQKPPEPIRALVDILTVTPATYPVELTAMGTVVPAREVTLKARVSGEIIAVHPTFIEGGRLAKDDELVSIDPLDYELALATAQGRLAQVEFEATLETGRQSVARREWDLLSLDDATDTERALALRQPHLVRVKANLAAAQADLRRAAVNLERTSVRVPFDALILDRYVERGALVREQDPLVQVVDTSEYWVRVSVPVDRLRWIDIPQSQGETGSPVTITTTDASAGVTDGQVLRLQGDLDPAGRMARVLIAVQDPLAVNDASSGRASLLLGSYVHIVIRGQELHEVYRIPRNALRENGTVWIANANDQLELRAVTAAWRGKETVLISHGLIPGDRVISTNLAMPVSGMPLTFMGAAPDA
jgi:RND family efflux transporter MFP subunit